MAGLLRVWLTAALVAAVGWGLASCGGSNPAKDFCNSYGDAMHGIVAAARQYPADPAAFASTYKSTMDTIGQIRAKAPDDRLRAAFDRAMFTFSVFDADEDLADFLARADFSTNAVFITCADYGVDITV